MPVRFLPLLLLLPLCGCFDHCPILCSDPSKTQSDYVSARNECQQLADIKAGNGGAPGEATESPKNRLLKLFSQCMDTKGWSVPGPSTPAAAAAVAPKPAEGAVPLLPVSQEAKDARTQRAADCAFARQAAATSPIAKERAEACDIECAEMSRAAPDAPKPGACP